MVWLGYVYGVGPEKLLKEILKNHPEMSVPVAAIQVLSETIRQSRATTIFECIRELECSTRLLLELTHRCVSISAGCELFTRVVTRAASESTEVLPV